MLARCICCAPLLPRLGIIALLTLAASTALSADKKNNRRINDLERDVKRHQESVRDAQQAAQQALRERNHAATNLDKAQRDADVQQRLMQKTRAMLEADRGESSALRAARQKRDQCQIAFDEVWLPLLKQLQQRADYAALVAQRADALGKLSQVEELEREVLVQTVAESASMLAALERQHQAAHPAVGHARQELDAAQQAFTQVDRETLDELSADPQLARERGQLLKLNSVVDDARQELLKRSATLNQATTKYQREVAELNRAQARLRAARADKKK